MVFARFSFDGALANGLDRQDLISGVGFDLFAQTVVSEQFCLRFRHGLQRPLAALEHVIELVPTLCRSRAQTGYLGERGYMPSASSLWAACWPSCLAVFLRELFADAGDALLQFSLPNASRRRPC